MFGINIEWGATAKEAEASNFFTEVPKIAKRFKWMYAGCLSLLGVMVYFSCFAGRDYKIGGFTGTVPLAISVGCHLITPVRIRPHNILVMKSQCALTKTL